MNAPYPLTIAISLWKRGEQVPLDILFALHQLGFSIPELEDKYCR